MEEGLSLVVTMEVTLHRFNRIFAMATCIIELFIPLAEAGGFQRGDDKAGIVASSHDFGLQDDPPRLGPGRRSTGELLVEAAAGRRVLTMCPGPGRPLLVQSTCLLHEGGGLAEQDGVPRSAEDKIGQAPLGKHLNRVHRIYLIRISSPDIS